MGIHIPTLLAALLEATAAEAAAKAGIAGYRAALEDEARRRLVDDGAAPTWKNKTLGTVRYDEPGAWTAKVVDEAAFASFVAEHHPESATATITLDARDLADALESLEFAGATVIKSAVEVRPAFAKVYLSDLAIDVDEDGDVPEFTIAEESGLLPAGLSGTRSAGKLVVTLDRDRRRGAIEDATKAADDLVAKATDDTTVPPAVDDLEPGDTPIEEPAKGLHLVPAEAIPTDAELDALDVLADDLEGAGNREQLRTVARAKGLRASGTKADVAKVLAGAGVTVAEVSA